MSCSFGLLLLLLLLFAALTLTCSRMCGGVLCIGPCEEGYNTQVAKEKAGPSPACWMDGAGMLHVRPRPTPCTHLLVQWVPGEDAHAIWRLLREQVHEGHEAPPALELTGQKVQVLVGLQGGRVESFRAYAEHVDHVLDDGPLLAMDHALCGRLSMLHLHGRSGVDLQQPGLTAAVHQEVQPKELEAAVGWQQHLGLDLKCAWQCCCQHHCCAALHILP
mmetsp:Transcript_25621/g.69502  ORF Transcript_25621/g.69502 Transcript_25621/m.69502 type:complete len:219 (-) Transcript_25621:1292-1948(-)